MFFFFFRWKNVHVKLKEIAVLFKNLTLCFSFWKYSESLKFPHLFFSDVFAFAVFGQEVTDTSNGGRPASYLWGFMQTHSATAGSCYWEQDVDLAFITLRMFKPQKLNLIKLKKLNTFLKFVKKNHLLHRLQMRWSDRTSIYHKSNINISNQYWWECGFNSNFSTLVSSVSCTLTITVDSSVNGNPPRHGNHSRVNLGGRLKYSRDAMLLWET